MNAKSSGAVDGDAAGVGGGSGGIIGRRGKDKFNRLESRLFLDIAEVEKKNIKPFSRTGSVSPRCGFVG